MLNLGDALLGLGGCEAGGEVVSISVGWRAGEGEGEAGGEGECFVGRDVMDGVDGDEGDGLTSKVGLCG